jgi:lipoate synthase
MTETLPTTCRAKAAQARLIWPAPTSAAMLTKKLMRSLNLATCARRRRAATSANAGQTGHATVMILGDTCTPAPSATSRPACRGS